MTFNFIKPTLIFSIIGLFIPGFTAILLFGIQMSLYSFGIDCEICWKIIWSLTTITGIALPIYFIQHIKKITSKKIETLKTKLLLFNLIEYICIQSSLGSLFSNTRTLCYESDGQNGLELVFTAWFSLPILITLAFVFNRILKEVMYQNW